MEIEPGLRTDVAVGRILERLRAAVLSTVDGAVRGADPEPLHDLRVAVRRARSVLSQVRGVVPKARVRPLKRDLRWLASVTGPCRDLDVLLDDLAVAGEGRSQFLAAGFGELREAADGQRRRTHAVLVLALEDARFSALLELWEALARTAREGGGSGPRAGAPVEETAGRCILRAHRRLVEHGLAPGGGPPDEQLHRVRIDAKKLRYLLDLFGSLYPRQELRALLHDLKGLQDILGRHHDTVVQESWLEDLVGRAGPSRSAAAAALVFRGWLVARRERFRHRFGPAFAVLAGPGWEARLRELVSRGRPPVS